MLLHQSYLTIRPFPAQILYLSWQRCQTGWRHQGGYSEQTEQSQERLQESERSLEIITDRVKTKLKLYQSCVLSTLLNGSECWRISEHDLAKLLSFHTTSLRKIRRIFWPRTISNRDLLARCQQEDMETIITRKRWRWTEHVLRKDDNSITKVAIRRTPEGKRKRGRPKTTWRRTVEAEMKRMNHSWGTIRRLASDRQGRWSFVAALYASWCDG